MGFLRKIYKDGILKIGRYEIWHSKHRARRFSIYRIGPTADIEWGIGIFSFYILKCVTINKDEEKMSDMQE